MTILEYYYQNLSVVGLGLIHCLGSSLERDFTVPQTNHQRLPSCIFRDHITSVLYCLSGAP